jgi:phenylpropionate dioxygenase-like ring-hydroxylating dioxygenase large terminal subunit
MIVPSNWKVMLETFMEGYHVPVTHPTIMDPAIQSVLNVVTGYSTAFWVVGARLD